MSLAAQVTTTGMSVPSYEEILASLITSFQAIYGADAYLGADSQDYQLLAVFASAINDCNQMALSTYNAFSPSTAQGTGLSSVVKINGIARLIASKSSVDVTLVGQAGTNITNGIVSDDLSQRWALPASVTIPVGGNITVTATAVNDGATPAAANTVTQISTPTRGWQSVNNDNPATLGSPVEQDATLRIRQAASTSVSAITPLGALFGALSNLPGVTEIKIYENDTTTTDGNGLPAKSISVVIAGGDVDQIAQTIGQKKTPGCATYGSTSHTYADPVTGIIYTINFYILALSEIKVAVTGTARTGYSAGTATLIKNAIAAQINALAIGVAVDYSRIWAPAYLNGDVIGTTYEITGLTIALGAGMPGTIDIPIDFNKAAMCDPTIDVTVTIT